MRHAKAGRKLKRTHSHRKALLSALSLSLITRKRIRTTIAKAKETKQAVEKIITRAKNAVAKEQDAGKIDVHARREVFKVLQSRIAVSELFKQIAPKVLTRRGGYTRIIRIGRRHGDGAEMAYLELVDFNVAQEAVAAREKSKQAKKPEKKTKESPTTTPAESAAKEPAVKEATTETGTASA
jgi:large subunit ribosomal protein L17